MGQLRGDQGIFTNFPEWVKKELNRRRDEDFLVDRPDSAWVRMTSNFGDRKVLMGGDLDINEAMRFGFSELYEFNDSVPPQRPVPGINSVNITDSTDITEASVDWTVNSLDQLEDLFKFFFNPGVTILLEIGWSSVDKSGVMDVSNLDEVKSTFKNISRTKNEGDTIFGRNHPRYDKQKRGNGKYFILPGFLKNFSFSMNEQGGFDCTTEIQQISESFYFLSLRTDKGERSGVDSIPGKFLQFLKEDVNFNNEQEENESGETHKFWTHAIGDMEFIRFLDFIEIINRFFEVFTEDEEIRINHIDVEDVLISNFIGSSEFVPEIDDASLKSMDPEVCIINNLGDGSGDAATIGPLGIKPFTQDVPEDLRDRRGSLKNLYVNKKFIKNKAESSNTLKQYLTKILQSCSEACFGIWDFEIGIKDGDIFIFDRNAPTNVPIEEINPNLDNGNDNDIYIFRPYDENSQIRSISFDSNLDDNVKNIMAAKNLAVNGDPDNVTEKPIMDGWSDSTGQFFRRFEGKDQIIDKLFSGDKKDTEKDQSKENKTDDEDRDKSSGLKAGDAVANLVRQTKGIDETNPEDQRDDQLKEWFDKISNSEIRQVFFVSRLESFVLSRLINRDENKNSPVNSNAIIDINVSLTLSGIAGLRRFQLFQINHIPDFYRDNGLFVIDKVEHNLSNNDWQTQIKGKYVVGNLYAKNIRGE